MTPPDLTARATAWLREHCDEGDSCSDRKAFLVALLAEVDAAAREEEREACARECEADAAEWAAVLDPSQSSLAEIGTAMNCARRIRARGEKR